MKKITLSIIVLFISLSMFSQELIWEKLYGGYDNDVAYYVINNDDGTFVTIGYTESFGTGVWGKPDMYMCKFDADGDMLWDKTYGQPDSLDKAYFGLKIDDGYLLVGERFDDIVAANGMCGVIVKTDFDGNEIWSKKYQGDNKDMLRHIQPVQNNGFIACGVTRSNGAGFIDGWAVKLDDDFNIEWQSNFGGANYEVFKQIYPTPDGGYLAGGFSNSDGAGSYDIWFVKIDAQGDMEWEKRIGNEYSNRINWFTPTVDGNYISTGRSMKDAAEEDELFVLKITPDADVIWEQYYQSNSQGEGHFIEELTSKGYIIAGADANAIGGPWQTDGWVLRINDDGELIWDYFVHGQASDDFYVARQNVEGDIIAAGGNMSSGAGKNDLWLTKLSDSTYITNVNNKVTFENIAYPNPTSGLINILVPPTKSNQYKINIVDMLGKTVYNTQGAGSENSKITVDLSNVKKGFYTIQLITEDDIYLEKVIVE